ncbi:MAG TPA: RagB/SusD family nutrient uptake outer membrane protein [Chitinophagaceae bacterium]|nr:RagB/SusD family nutrient uptake outer membrane protein [Chitinophagaceae bacterium]
MKRYKLFFILFAAVSLIQMSACKKELAEVKPQDAISKDQVLTDPNAALTLYTGMYGLFRSYNATFYQLGEMRSEIWTDGLFTESADAGLQNLSRQNISALNVPFNNWAGFYNLIYNLNNVITLFPQTPLSQPDKDRMMAEAYGLRAYVYYTMLKTWGAVPLTTQPVETISNAAETFKARTPADSIMLQVKSDIEKSLQLFGSSNVIPAGKRVYWNRVATLVLKGDVFLWSGTNMGGGTQDFTTAKTALQEVENLQGPTLNLNANYADIFDPAKKNNNPEIIFAINYETGQAGNGVFGSFQVNSIQATTLSLAPATTPLVSTVYPFVNGANRIGMNQAMITRLTSGAADQRISNSFKIMYSNTTPFAVRGVLLTKWLGSTSGTSQVFNNDYPIYRYADVLLLMAEAKAKLGQDPSPEINLIRQRAYGSSFTPYVNGSVDANIKAILEEYLREFIGEGKRWWALRRAGDQYVYANINPAYLSLTSTAKLLLPISTSMINNDPLLTQTPGY